MNTTDAYEPPKNGWRTFVTVWATQSFSIVGTQIMFFALTIWIAQVLFPRPDQKAELALAFAAEGIIFGVVTMLAAPIAGAWADRHDRKCTMIAMDIANGILSIVLMLLVSAQVLELWMWLIMAGILACTSTFHGAAFDTSYAMLVSEKQLPRANGMMQTIWSLAGILAPIVAAAILTLPGFARDGVVTGDIGRWLAGLTDATPITMSIDAVSYFLAAGVLVFLTIPSPKRTDLMDESGKKKSLWADVKEGGRYIWYRRPLLWLLGTFTVANFFGSFWVLQTLIVKFNLAPDWQANGFTFESALAFISTVIGIGGLVGGLFISSWGGLKKRRVYGVVIPMIIGGIAQIAYGLSLSLYLSAAMAFIVVGVIPILNAHSQAIWQTQTPRELQGRVFSVRRVIAQFSAPIATALAGWLGGLYNPGVVIAIFGAIMAVFCIGQMFNPLLLRVEDKAWLDEMATQREASAANRLTVGPTKASDLE